MDSHASSKFKDQIKQSTVTPIPELGEPDAHIMMRRAKSVVRLLMVLAIIAAVLSLVFFRPAAYLAALPIPILFVLYVIVSLLEQQARASALRRPGQTTISNEEIETDVRSAGFYTGLAIAIVLALGTFVVAISFYEWPLVGFAAAALLFLATLIEIPYLTLFIAEAERDERDKITHDSQTDDDTE